METTTLAIIGAHGAGKTALGKAIARSCQCTFHPEIGERLRNKMLAEEPGAHAAMAQQAFDDKVIRSELERDAAWKHSRGNLRVVETWHPGNYAYAMQRRSRIAETDLIDMRRALSGAIILPLRIKKVTALARLREENENISSERLTDFFLAVAKYAESYARRWCPKVLPALFTDEQPLEETVAQALVLLEKSSLVLPQ